MPKKDVGDKEDGDKSDREALECIALNAFDRIIVGGLSLGSSVTFLGLPSNFSNSNFIRTACTISTIDH